jgi:hypothetical protein
MVIVLLIVLLLMLLAFVPCERRRCVVRRTAISAGSETGSSSGEGSPWAE